jgi:hypothetical protein
MPQYKVFIYVKFPKTVVLKAETPEAAAASVALLPAPEGGEIEVVDVEEGE